MKFLSIPFGMFGLLLVTTGVGCGEPGAAMNAALLDDATALAALSDGDGEDLAVAFAAIDLELGAEEDVDFETTADEDYARDCRFIEFRRRVVGEYDSDGDGGLSRDERYALRDDFGEKPFRRRRHARFHKFARLRWIYDADDSGRLDAGERDELRMDLELRCMNREAILIETYDDDGDGELDDDEWTAAVEALADRRAARREAFLTEYDDDGDGSLDFFERVEAHIDRLQKIIDRHDAALETYDEDGDGALDADERMALRENLKARVRGEHWGDAEPE